MGFGASLGLEHDSSKEETDTSVKKVNTTDSSGTTVNSGSTNTSTQTGNTNSDTVGIQINDTSGKSTNTGTTNNTGTSTNDSTGTNNNTSNTNNTSKTDNSGSTNTSHTTNSGTTINSGSVNTTENSGSINYSGSGPSRNTTTVGPSSTTQHNSGRIDTSQVMLTQAATDRIAQQILESNQGLAAVSSGVHSAGGYNSSTHSMLVNDLLARTAGEVAVRGAQTVNNIGSSDSTSNTSAVTTTQDIGATQAYNIIGGSSSTTNIGGSVSKNFSDSDLTNILGASSSTSTNSGTTTNRGTSTNSNTGTSTNNGSSTNTGTNSSTGTTGSNTKNNTNSSLDISNIIGGSTINNINHSMSVDDIIGAVLSEKQSNQVKAEAKGGWILCTELYKQGRMPHKFYKRGSLEFASYEERGKKGYYIWAVPALAHLRKHPYSRFSKLMCVLLNARAEHISARRGCKEAKKSVLGWFADKTMYWGCWILSRTIARNYNSPTTFPIGVTSHE